MIGPIVAVVVAMVALWAISVRVKDASIVDVFWGPGFVLIAGIANLSGGWGPRRALVGLLVAAWGIRLGTHLYLRNRGKGEDTRYKAMRKARGEHFARDSLFTVFGFQGVLMLAVSAPIQYAITAKMPDHFTVFDVLGVVLWLVGFTFETVGDVQLTRFKSDPENKGVVFDQGLWRYTRHPNYFGDATVWWGFGMFAIAVGAWWALAGPVIMTVLLLRVSGVPLLEKRMSRTRKGYRDYATRTSTFFPMPPKATTKEDA